LRASPLANWFYRISGLEQSAIPQHGMHDEGDTAGERDPGLSEAASLRDLERPVFSAKLCLVRVRIELAAS
jgi:hypothetical protein